jgi:hypothetical protein
VARAIWERFSNAGHSVAGIGFSKCSIEYAKGQRAIYKSDISYFYQGYLTMDYGGSFSAAD